MPIFCIVLPGAYFFLFHMWSIFKQLGGGKENAKKALKAMSGQVHTPPPRPQPRLE
jgi:hypothetical protein